MIAGRTDRFMEQVTIKLLSASVLVEINDKQWTERTLNLSRACMYCMNEAARFVCCLLFVEITTSITKLINIRSFSIDDIQ